jgi:hypothetical protein
MAKEPEFTEKVTFWTDLTQRLQLDELYEKESVNKSKFIRDAIREKLERWRNGNRSNSNSNGDRNGQARSPAARHAVLSQRSDAR